MNKEDLYKMIEKEIQTVAFDYLKEKSLKEKAQSTDDHLNSRSITDTDVDHILFHGGGAPREEDRVKGRITIKEGAESNLKITVSEIKQFENSFEDILKNIPGASIVFDKQKNGYSIIATKRPDGVEAKASGIINLGDNGKLIWSYSILNGFNLNAQNLKLSQGNKTMFEALSNHYDDWQKKWRENLNLPSAPESTDNTAAQSTGALPGADMAPPDQNAPPVTGGAAPAPAA
jgi:hypothetical protein